MRYFKPTIKWSIFFCLGLALVLLIKHGELSQILVPTLQWIDGLGNLGAIAFVGIYIVANIFCIPGSILALAGGVLFGKVVGACLVFTGGFIGAYNAFILGRYFLQTWVEKRAAQNSYLKIIDRIIETEGWKIACLLHLSPLIPFNLLNYALGASKITHKSFIFATAIGILPGVILYTFLGSSISDLTMIFTGMLDDSDRKIQWLFSILGIVSTLGISLYLAQLARQEIANRMES